MCHDGSPFLDGNSSVFIKCAVGLLEPLELVFKAPSKADRVPDREEIASKRIDLAVGGLVAFPKLIFSPLEALLLDYLRSKLSPRIACSA